VTALWIAHVRITDPVGYGEYAKRAGPALAAYGGVFLARGGAYEQLEGADFPRNVVARFATLQAAHDCYHSPAYQEALRFGLPSAERSLVIVEEVAPA
jgi:uncharacterized protein (DUF1330 family)